MKAHYRRMAAGISLALLPLASDAAIWKGWNDDYPKDLASLTVLPAPGEPSKVDFKPLVVLRFPVSVDSAHLDAAREEYRWKSGKGDDYRKIYKDKELDKYALDMLLVKTAHHALELESCLAQHTADVADVVIEPYSITKEGGAWTRTTPEVMHTASAVVDFFTRTEAYAMAVTNLTFGPRYQPVFSVRVAPEALAATNGAIAGPLPHNPLLHQNTAYAGIDARAGHGVNLVDFLNAPPLKRTSFPGWGKEPPAGLASSSVTEKGPFRLGTYLALPIVSEELVLDDNGAALESNRQDCAVIANLLRTALAPSDARQKVESQRLAAFARNFDPGLADLVMQGAALTPDQQERLTLIESFYAAEISFLQQQDVRMHAELVTGPWAESFYAARAEEVNSYRKRKVGIGAMLALSTVATAGAAAGVAGTSLMTMALFESTENNLANDLAQLRGPQVQLGEYVIDISAAGQQITATTTEQLRSALLQMYANKYAPRVE